MQLAMRAARTAVRIGIAGAAAQPIAGCTPARYKVGGATQIHCRSRGAPGDASRQDRRSDQNRGAAAQPIAGCTPECRTTAPTRTSPRQALAPNHKISNKPAANAVASHGAMLQGTNKNAAHMSGVFVTPE